MRDERKINNETNHCNLHSKNTYILLNGPGKLGNVGIGHGAVEKVVVGAGAGGESAIKGLGLASNHVLVLGV